MADRVKKRTPQTASRARTEVTLKKTGAGHPQTPYRPHSHATMAGRLRSRKRGRRRKPSIDVAHPHREEEALPATRSDIRQSPPLPLLAATAGQRKKAELSVSQSKEAVISPLIKGAAAFSASPRSDPWSQRKMKKSPRAQIWLDRSGHPHLRKRPQLPAKKDLRSTRTPTPFLHLPPPAHIYTS
jgi:hypothetical protein